ncbi:ribosome maturation factor RimM [Aquabacterium sp.]|uniref:ribosome maturation factor RimM n=1 Tax=Aquabacterium sp. TaxID=1872578 RepID=UPI0025B96C79|nr:ribosome maturation factor RimM [Aquabacterium sp.]
MNDRAPVSAPLVLNDGVVWPEDAVEVGRIVDAWGVKGGIKVQPFSSDPQALFCTKKWFLRPAEQAPGAVSRPSAKAGDATRSAPARKVAAGSAPMASRLAAPRFLQMKVVREQGDIVVATSEDLADRNAAEALKGARVFVSRSAFPTPDEGEYYWIDLIGLDVFNPAGEALGKVVDLLDTGPQSVLRLEAAGATPADTVERLIPFVDAYIVSVSLADKRIVADWGLDY